jgi:AraC-like DNA-binding protein
MYNTEVKIQDLAAELSLHARYLSQVINETLYQNFFDFINDYRIKEAQNQLLDQHNGHKTVLEILYDVGFNTKSTFNYVFKKKTGLIPTQYRKQHPYETVQNPADKELHRKS